MRLVFKKYPVLIWTDCPSILEASPFIPREQNLLTIYGTTPLLQLLATDNEHLCLSTPRRRIAGFEVQLFSFLTSELHRGECSTSRASGFTLGKGSCYPLNRAPQTVWTFWRKVSCLYRESNPTMAQSAASRYPDWV